MKKTAIFVEGQTELIIVRELILRLFEYTDVSIECRTLVKDGKLQKAEYDFPNDNAANYFQIINVGNDNAVLSRILKREEKMWNAGYQKIIGLRDMYGHAYRKESSSVSMELNNKFIQGTNETIAKLAKNPDQMFLCFSIMETESWFLGIKDIFKEVHKELTSEHILEKLNLNLDEIDPEKEIFHPAKIVNDIYSLAGLRYTKKKGDIESIASKCDLVRYNELIASGKCSSFANFHEILTRQAST